jgi:hypothetical protein
MDFHLQSARSMRAAPFGARSRYLSASMSTIDTMPESGAM